MLKKVEKNAKSEAEAVQLAAEELGVPVSEVSYEVEREVGKGLMGLLLGKEVIISAWRTKDAEEEEKIKAVAKERARSEEAASAENPYAPKEAPQTRDYIDGGKRKKKKSAELPKNEPAPVEAPVEEAKPVEAKASKKNREVTEKSVDDAKFFVTEVLHKMGLSDAEVTSENAGDYVSVDVSGSKMGLLIGKRGDTLDAVQYLASLYVNKEKNSYIKVTVDTENYRSKREETLTKLARSLERRVVRENNAITLEPMNPNERRIIHSALQGSNRVKTYSVGEEPNRKVVVALK